MYRNKIYLEGTKGNNDRDKVKKQKRDLVVN